jgi:hypothetical protein
VEYVIGRDDLAVVAVLQDARAGDPPELDLLGRYRLDLDCEQVLIALDDLPEEVTAESQAPGKLLPPVLPADLGVGLIQERGTALDRS